MSAYVVLSISIASFANSAKQAGLTLMKIKSLSIGNGYLGSVTIEIDQSDIELRSPDAAICARRSRSF
jgi:hypothetical protein